MSKYNLIEYSNIYSKTSRSLCKYCRNEPDLDNNNNVIDFPVSNNDSISFKFKEKIKRGKPGIMVQIMLT